MERRARHPLGWELLPPREEPGLSPRSGLGFGMGRAPGSSPTADLGGEVPPGAGARWFPQRIPGLCWLRSRSSILFA